MTREDGEGALSAIRRPLHDVHSLRVSVMKSYECFRTQYWQNTLNDMFGLTESVELENAVEFLGAEAFSQYVTGRIKS
jgi:hypothetical protein